MIATNRDPAECEQPEEFRIDRPRGRHLSFGHGVHRGTSACTRPPRDVGGGGRARR
ncbi:hypothetical protein [Lentzea roselyniae]|uniref:hypothetical protein n=1 Tax=Lentzea roselyniae TaxID=531940 RepID=UPI0031F89394